MKTIHRFAGLLPVAMISLGAAAVLSPVGDAVAWLESVQDPSGSWGTSLQVADTATVVETLAAVDPTLPALADAAEWLSEQPMANLQGVARRAAALSQVPDFALQARLEALELLGPRNAVEPNPALPNWPEGGWGVAAGFATDCTSTALALSAMATAGLSGGLSVEDEPLAASTAKIHPWTIVADAMKARIVITVGGSTVRLRMRQGSPPTNADPFFSLAPGTYLIVFPDSGLPFTPGQNFIRLQNTTGVAASYSFTGSYETPELDTRAFAEALDYLEQSQNPDGGWGIQRGASTDLFTSLHVLLALQAHPGYDLDVERSAGLAYLLGEQLPGGGFGFDGMTALAHVTAVAALNLVRSEGFPFASTTNDAIAALLGLQEMDGSWANQPYHTGLAVRALWEHNQAPTVDAGPDQSLPDADGDGMESLMLAGSGGDVDGSIVSFAWSENGMSLASGPTPTVDLDLGTHTLLLTVTDDGGRTASNAVEVTVSFVCDPVTALACESSGMNILLTWMNADSYAFVDILRNGELIGTEGPGASSFTDLAVPAGIYTYSVIGYCDGTTPASAVDCTLRHLKVRPSAPPVPAPPVGLPLTVEPGSHGSSAPLVAGSSWTARVDCRGQVSGVAVLLAWGQAGDQPILLGVREHRGGIESFRTFVPDDTRLVGTRVQVQAVLLLPSSTVRSDVLEFMIED